MAFPSESNSIFVPEFPLDRNNSGLEFLKQVGVPIPQLGGGAYLPTGSGLSLQIHLPTVGHFC